MVHNHELKSVVVCDCNCVACKMITLRKIETSESLIHVYVAHCATDLTGWCFRLLPSVSYRPLPEKEIGHQRHFYLKLQELKESVENWGYKLNLNHFGDM